MSQSPGDQLPDGFVVISDYDPPIVLIRVIQTSIAIVVGFLARDIVTQTGLTPRTYLMLFVTVLCTVLLHHGVHATTEFLLNYTPRFQIFPPRSIGPPSPVSRNHMVVILLMPLFAISIALFSVHAESDTVFIPVVALILNGMLSVNDVWASLVLSRKSRDTKVWMKEPDPDSNELSTLLIAPASTTTVGEGETSGGERP